MPSFGPISSHPVSGLFSAKERKDVSASMDATIAHINIEAMAGMDAAVQLFASNRVDIDAILKNFGVARGVALEAALQIEAMVDGNMDSALQISAEQQADINAILVNLIESRLSVNAALQAPNRSAGLQADSALKTTDNLKVVDVDGQLLISGVEQGQIDSCLAQLSAESFADFDGSLVVRMDKSLLLGAILKIAGQVPPVGLDAVVLPDISNRPTYAWLQYPAKLEVLQCPTEVGKVQYPAQALHIEHLEEDREVDYYDKIRKNEHPGNIAGVEHEDKIYPIR